MKDIYKILADLDIDYVKHEHLPILTCEEGLEYRKGLKGLLIKNIFLRNKRGQRHYLVVIPQTKEVNLVKVRECVRDSKLGFAQEEYLKKYLDLVPGSVSLLGLINDAEKHVQVVIDNEVWKSDLICVHPNTNMATLEIKREDLQKFLDHCGNKVYFYDL
ncbi:prolyl-tRNA synthetase associated domain-containing protein [Candidatus Peregrinibacteria bacterium]|nr:prolyl-tRNA synthetase associated domain-containing protein [Candidatus Peregrinibacteria bacterium]